MATTITNFYRGETKIFSIILSEEDVVKNITSDTVTFRMKRLKADDDSNAVITKVADVASQGANGIAVFELAPEVSAAIAAGLYYCSITWELSSGREYAAYSDKIELLER